MGRKPTTTKPVGVDIDTLPLAPAVVEAANVRSTIQANYNDDRDLVNQLLGQAQMAGAFEEFSRTVRTSKLAFVKENKLYRALSGRKNPHGAGFLNGNWDEFCSLLGRSVDQVDRDIANLRAFGEEALDSMSRMGIGYREMRQFRKLPDDQKAALIEVAKTGDKEAFVELAEEVIAKHAKEKEALSRTTEELRENLEAKEQIMANKNTKIDQLAEELARVRKQVVAMPPADVGEKIRAEATQHAAGAEVGILSLRHYFLALVEHAEKNSISHGEVMSGLLCQLEHAINTLRFDFNIKAAPNGDIRPDWMVATSIPIGN